MNTYGSVLPGAARIARVPVLSREAKKRLAWMDWYERHRRNARLTCRHFGISPDTFYVLDGVQYHPHATLYKVTASDASMTEVFRVVSMVAEFHQLSIPFARPESGRGYMLIRLEQTTDLQALHSRMVRAVNPYRIPGSRIRNTGRRAFTTDEARHNAQYGHPNVLSTYKPHLTIVRLRDAEAAVQELAAITWQPTEFVATTIGVYNMGDHGTCRQLLHRVELLRGT